MKQGLISTQLEILCDFMNVYVQLFMCAGLLLPAGSKLGAMLDQLIDRITTMCLCAALCHLYPKYMLFFQFAMALDIFSHWMHCQRFVMNAREGGHIHACIVKIFSGCNSMHRLRSAMGVRQEVFVVCAGED